MRITCLLAGIGCLLSAGIGVAADLTPAPREKGTVRFQPIDDQAKVPERYRLAEHAFDYELELKRDLPSTRVELYHLRFPSPVQSPCPQNNTVHAEYYRPKGKGPFPGVIVLDITAGDQSLSRSIASMLAQNGVAGLFVQMAYYGPRRPAGSSLRLMSPNYPQTIAAVRQTVLDLRCAAAWLEARPEIDGKSLGVVGTSLGSMMAALTAEMEPRLGRVVVLLGGGGLVDAYYDNDFAVWICKVYEMLGGTRERLKELIAPVDPLTCAANLKDRRLLMIAARHDEIVPPKAAEALWVASGKQKIVWYDCGHYTAVLYFAPAMRQIIQHFREP